MIHTLPLHPLVLAMAGSPGGSPLAPFLFEVVLIFAIFYFLLFRPQQQQRKRHEQRLQTLKRGDEVVTAGGSVGEVVHIRETAKDGGANRLDDRVTIKSAESRIVVERGRIAKVVTPAAGETTEAP